MNCERFQTVAADLARAEMFEAGERANALTHIDGCDRCAQSWSRQRELSDGLQAVANQMKSFAAPAHLEAQLLAAFRNRTRMLPVQATPRWRYLVSAIAAVLLLAFAVMAWRVRVAAPPAPPTLAQSGVPGTGLAVSSKPLQSPVAAIERPNEAPVPGRGASGTRPVRSAALRRAGTPLPAPDAVAVAKNSEVKESEVATDFVSLGYGSALDLQDGGQLVRVELPRSALVRFGLPMNMDRADERVKADVLVGTDGLARAIRFVK